eukprot:RCo002238
MWGAPGYGSLTWILTPCSLLTTALTSPHPPLPSRWGLVSRLRRGRQQVSSRSAWQSPRMWVEPWSGRWEAQIGPSRCRPRKRRFPVAVVIVVPAAVAVGRMGVAMEAPPREPVKGMVQPGAASTRYGEPHPWRVRQCGPFLCIYACAPPAHSSVVVAHPLPKNGNSNNPKPRPPASIPFSS